MAPVALSRTCDLTDFPHCLTVASWQQQLAVEAWRQWVEAHHVRTREPSLCVNWSGCEFVAPGPEAIYRYRGHGEDANGDGEITPGRPALFGLSVLDHAAMPLRFLTRAAQILRPSGLLVLTFSYWSCEGPDVADGHEGRIRIYDARSYMRLLAESRKIGFVPFGEISWEYHGDFLGDHSLASLVLVKR